MARRIFLLLISRRIFFYLVIYLAILFVPASPTLQNFDPSDEFQRVSSPLEWVWGNFDGSYYLGIAKRGYFQGEQAFFPLYPYFIGLVYSIVGFNFIISGQIVSFIALFVSTLLIIKVLKIDGFARHTTLALWLFLLFPTSFYYSAIYNDSTFFLLATACIYFSRTRQFFCAGVAGALATLTRLNGLALLFLVLFEYGQGHPKMSVGDSWRVSSWKKAMTAVSWPHVRRDRLYVVLLIPIVFVGYLIFIHNHFGSWLTLFTSMESWGQARIILPPQVIWRYIKILVLYPTFKFNYWIAVLELSSVLFYLSLLLVSIKRIRFSYWMFFAVSIVIPWLTGTFQGMPRYGLHLYPFFLSLLLWYLQLPRLAKVVYWIVSVSLLIILLSLFTRGYFVA